MINSRFHHSILILVIVLIGIADLVLRPVYGGLVLHDLASRSVSIMAILMLVVVSI